MDVGRRLLPMIRSIPPGQQVGIGIGLVVLVMASFLFFQWVTAPSYTVLYAGLEASRVQAVIDELESQGVDYRLEAAGSRIMVPRADVYEVRASLAAQGVQGSVVPEGYELLEGQSLTITDFQQRITYQRALEGELAKTLMAMDSIAQASVHLVMPEQPLFEEERQPTTASVLIAPERPLSQVEVESIVFLVSSSVEGLEASNVTVADSSGTTLHVAGEDSTTAGLGSRNLRQVRDFEAALTKDITHLLQSVLGVGRVSAVVRAQLDFDERSVESETFETEPVTLREQTVEEEFTGQGAAPAGAVGVDGGVVTTDDGEYEYMRNEVLREYGIDRMVSTVTEAPGAIERLSVAVIVDAESLGGTENVAADDIERLVAAAVGLERERGDVIEVSAMSFPTADATEPESLPAAAGEGITTMIPQIAGGVMLLLVLVGLLLMTRGRKRAEEFHPAPLPLPTSPMSELAPVPAAPRTEAERTIQNDVIELVQGQPEEIATLLRGWLADRR